MLAYRFVFVEFKKIVVIDDKFVNLMCDVYF